MKDRAGWLVCDPRSNAARCRTRFRLDHPAITLRFGRTPALGDRAGRITHRGGPSDTAATGRVRLTIERMRTPNVWSIHARLVAGDRDAVRIGAIRPTGALTLGRFYAALSPESRRTRFFWVGSALSHGQDMSSCATDHDHRERIVRFTATMSASNAPIRRLPMGLGPPTRLRYVGSGAAETAIDLVGQSVAA